MRWVLHFSHRLQYIFFVNYSSKDLMHRDHFCNLPVLPMLMHTFQYTIKDSSSNNLMKHIWNWNSCNLTAIALGIRRSQNGSGDCYQGPSWCSCSSSAGFFYTTLFFSLVNTSMLLLCSDCFHRELNLNNSVVGFHIFNFSCKKKWEQPIRINTIVAKLKNGIWS